MLRGRVAPVAPLLGAWRIRSLATTSTQEQCLYDLLGVKQSADQKTIKEAFRKKAKRLHPDAQGAAGQADQAAFVRLLAAYQILSNPRSRELYDLSVSARGSRFLRQAAAAGVRGGGGEEEVAIDISWGLGALFNAKNGAAAAGEKSTMLDKLRSELQSDINAALRHAYLGPKLDLAEAAWLPDCFEADERSTPEAPELLELVSGRQLLGVVRERRAAQLAARAVQRRAGLGAGGAGAGGGLLGGGAGAAQPDGLAWAHPGGQQLGGEGWGGGATAPSGPGGGASDPEAGEGGASPGLSGAPEGASGGGWEVDGHGEEEAEVLELVMGERQEVVASAVRHRGRHGPQRGAARTEARAVRGRSSSSGAGGGSQSQAGAGGGAGGGSDAGAGVSSSSSSSGGSSGSGGEEPAGLVVSFYRGEQLLGRLHAEHEAATSNSPSTARFVSAEGVHTHTVLRSCSPLVRHLTIVAEPTTGLAPSRRSRATVFRARRAWLPPSGLWLFKPRNWEHDIGGWYVEWAGHEQSHHPAWLDPAVCVLATGFDTLDHERARQQPQGLFGRVRGGDETAGGPLSWLRAMLRFHGVRK